MADDPFVVESSVKCPLDVA